MKMNTKKLLLIALVMGLGAGSASAVDVTADYIDKAILAAIVKTKKPAQVELGTYLWLLVQEMKKDVAVDRSKMEALLTDVVERTRNKTDRLVVTDIISQVVVPTTNTEGASVKTHIDATLKKWYEDNIIVTQDAFNTELENSLAMFDEKNRGTNAPGVTAFLQNTTQRQIVKNLGPVSMRNMAALKTVPVDLPLTTVVSWGIKGNPAQEIRKAINIKNAEIAKLQDMVTTMMIAFDKKAGVPDDEKIKINRLITYFDTIMGHMDYLAKAFDVSKSLKAPLNDTIYPDLKLVLDTGDLATTTTARDGAAIANSIENIKKMEKPTMLK